MHNVRTDDECRRAREHEKQQHHGHAARANRSHAYQKAGQQPHSNNAQAKTIPGHRELAVCSLHFLLELQQAWNCDEQQAGHDLQKLIDARTVMRAQQDQQCHQVCQFFCVNGSGFVFGMGLQGKVPLPLPIAVEIAFMTLLSPGPASVPAREC